MIPDTGSALYFWWTWVSDAFIQSSILIILLSTAERILSVRISPRLRSLLWGLVLLKLLWPPHISSPWSPAWLLEEHTDGLSRTLYDTEPDWASALFGLWLAGVMFFGILAVTGHVRTRRKMIRMSSADLPRGLIAQTTETAARAGLRQPPRIRLSRELEMPAVSGFFRPIIFLPEELLKRDRVAQLEHVLLHETAHLKRYDPWKGGLCLMAALIYWFHPGVWFISRRLAELRELCCDAFVAEVLGNEDVEYTRTLAFFALKASRIPLLGHHAMVRRSSQISNRLKHLEHLRSNPRRCHPVLAGVFLGILGVLIVPVGGITVGSASRADPWAMGPEADLQQDAGCLTLRYKVLRQLSLERAKNHNQLPDN